MFPSGPNRIPTDDEVAKAANLPLVTVQRLRNNRQADMQSLNDIIGDDQDGTELQDLLADQTTPPPDMALRKIEDIEQLFKLLETLSDRERQVLQMRFGLDGEAILTLDEVGKKLNCTNERVRQIQNEALRKLHDLMLADKQSEE
ncbi:MAG: sigma-70 family RNA polymerase sigma factor [Lentisphaeria bacterium]|nr:sigma-70 family RNA polymerase sigma factor [Lentisphaeria bacterium]